MHACMHINVHAHTYAHMHAHAYIYTHACTHTHAHTHACTHTHAHTHAHMHAHTYTCTCARTHTCMHAHTCSCARTHIHMHTHTHTHAHTYMYARTHTHACTNAHTHTHTHTHVTAGYSPQCSSTLTARWSTFKAILEHFIVTFFYVKEKRFITICSNQYRYWRHFPQTAYASAIILLTNFNKLLPSLTADMSIKCPPPSHTIQSDFDIFTQYAQTGRKCVQTSKYGRK
jgi:hypothetical protein